MARGESSQVVGNLPPEAMKIVGRRREVSEARRLMSDTRLLTLTGVGGVGKTRLALKIAGEMRRAFPDGVWLVELAPLQDRDLVARTVATALKLHDQSARSPAETLADHLRDKRSLLILDNCEHLLGPCASLVESLLEAVPQLWILATSRESFGLEGETILVVPPLSVPEADSQLSVDGMSRYEAVRMFTERAKMVMPEFTIDAGNQTAVAQLCRRLEGIPLSIQLAAAWLRGLSVEQILNRLDDRHRFLNRGFRTELPRHRSLHAAVGWSFGLCSPQEQTLWTRLSVFSGEFDLDAALAVCAGDPIASGEILDLVTALIEKSILSRMPNGSYARYQMLETLREYGHEQLVEAGVQRAVRRRHRDYYQRLAEEASADWLSPRQAEWTATIMREMGNIRIALDFSLTEPGEVEAGLTMAASLYQYWVLLGAHGEARHWIEQALSLDQDAGPAALHARAVSATTALLQGDTEAATRLMGEGDTWPRVTGDDRLQALMMSFHGLSAFLRGDLEDGLKLLKEVIDRYGGGGGDLAGRGVPVHIFLSSLYLTMTSAFLGDARTLDFATDCRRMAEAADAKWSMSWGLYAMALERWQAGDMERSAAFFRDCLRLQRDLADRWGPVWAIEALAWTAAAQRDTADHAACLLGIAETLRHSRGVLLAGLRPFSDAHEQCEAHLRRTMGDRAYTAAFQRHLDFGYDEAIAYAMGEQVGAGPDTSPASPAPAVLTAREAQVARLVAEGLTNKEIAARLVVAARTAEGHVERVLIKLGFTSRAQIVSWVSADDHGEAGR